MVKKLESSEFFTFFYESDFKEPVMVEELKILIEDKLGQDPEPIIVGKDNQKYLSFDWDKGHKLLNVYHLKEGFMVRYYDGNKHLYYLCEGFDELEIIISAILTSNEDLIFIEVKKLLQKKEDELRWYMEKYFSEEEMVKHSENLLRMISDNGEVAFIKMQFLKSKVLREKMYTEEEVLDLLAGFVDSRGKDFIPFNDIQQWFEKIKKK